MAGIAAILAKAEGLVRQARLEEAISILQRAAATRPNDTDVAWALGQLLAQAGRHAQAEFQFRRVLRRSPDLAAAHSALGEVLHALDRNEEALIAIEAALAINPDCGPTMALRASTLLTMRRHAEVLKILETADARGTSEELTAIRAQLAGEIGECDRWLADRVAKLNGDSPPNNLGFYACACSRLTAKQVFDMHAAIGRRVESWARPALPPLTNTPSPDRLLRVGFISPDIREHSIAYFLEPLLSHLDRDRLEAHLYLNASKPDTISSRLGGLARSLKLIPGLSEVALAERMRSDGIDVLVDLAGHTRGSAVLMFRSRLAPVQINYLGYPHSTGLSGFDARLVDSITDPPGSEQLATEPLVRLDPCFLCYKPPGDSPPPRPPRPAATREPITFGSFNSIWKLSDTAFKLICGVLAAVPRSRLLLKARAFDDPWVVARIRARFAEHNIDPQRIDPIAQTRTTAEHLALYNRVDIALDPTPYNGTTTTCEALHMGVPVVALKGDRHSARVSATLLAAIGRPEFVAQSLEQYVQIAAGLATDPNRLANLHGTLRQSLSGSALCDAAAFAQRFERAVRTLWVDWCRTRPASPQQPATPQVAGQ